MSLRKLLAVAAAPLALAAMSGCTQTFDARVNRFSMLPPVAQGETFTVQPVDPKLDGSIEFNSYAGLVAQELQRFGYRPAADARSANLVVSIDYWVENGREKVTSTPGFSGWGWGGYWGYPYRGGLGWGRGGWGRSGFYDPFWNDFGPDVRSYTVYDSQLRMEINRTAGGERVFEGTARATSRSDDLPWLVPNLVQAMFSGFPGNSGQTVRISIPQPSRRPAS